MRAGGRAGWLTACLLLRRFSKTGCVAVLFCSDPLSSGERRGQERRRGERTWRPKKEASFLREGLKRTSLQRERGKEQKRKSRGLPPPPLFSLWAWGQSGIFDELVWWVDWWQKDFHCHRHRMRGLVGRIERGEWGHEKGIDVRLYPSFWARASGVPWTRRHRRIGGQADRQTEGQADR